MLPILWGENREGCSPPIPVHEVSLFLSNNKEINLEHRVSQKSCSKKYIQK